MIPPCEVLPPWTSVYGANGRIPDVDANDKMIIRAVDTVKRPDVHEQQPVRARAEPYGPQ